MDIIIFKLLNYKFLSFYVKLDTWKKFTIEKLYKIKTILK